MTRADPELNGATRANATISALGDGSKASGGGIDRGLRGLRDSAIAVELAVFGISGAVTVARIAVRYRELVKQDRAIVAAIAEAQAANDTSAEPPANEDGTAPRRVLSGSHGRQGRAEAQMKG